MILGVDLKPGDTFPYRETLVTIIGEKQRHKDFFQRDEWAILATRADTGATGYLLFGDTGVFPDVTNPADL
jgi:hypothetical protein